MPNTLRAADSSITDPQRVRRCVSRTLAAIGSIACLLAATASRAEPALPLAGPLPMVSVGLLEGVPPVIDGNLDDACWNSCQELGPFIRQLGEGPAAVQTRAVVAYDATSLYVGVRCDEPDPAAIKTEMKVHDFPVWADDSVEIYLLPNPSAPPDPLARRHARFVVNSIGTLYDDTVFENSFLPSWESGAEVKALRANGFWSVEMRIPFACFDTPARAGSEWGFNVARSRHAGKEAELSAWSFTLGLFSEPRRFGTMRFVDRVPLRMAVSSVSPGAWGLNTAGGALRNAGAEPVECVFRVTTFAGGDPVFDHSAATRIEAGATAHLEREFTIEDGGENSLALEWRVEGRGNSDSRESSELGDGIKPVGRLVFPLILPNGTALRDVREHLAAIESMDSDNKLEPAEFGSLVRLARAALGIFDGEVGEAIGEKETLSPDRAEAPLRDIAALAARFDTLRFVPWTQSPWDDVAPDQRPDSLAAIKDIRILACQDETRSSVVNLTNFTGFDSDVRISLSDLRRAVDKVEKRSLDDKNPAVQAEEETTGESSVDGDAPSADTTGEESVLRRGDISVRVAIFRPLRRGGAVADPLIRLGELNRLRVPAGETRQLWMTFDTHRLRAGTYRGTLTIRPLLSATPKKTIAVTMEVRPLRLPAAMPIAVYLWDYARNAAYVDDLIAHRVNRLLIGTSVCLPKVDKDGTVLSVNYRSHDSQVERKRRPGCEIVYSYGVVRDFNERIAKPNGWDYLGPEWKKAFGAWFAGWIVHIRSLGLGYNDFCMQIWDEAAEADVDRVAAAGPFVRSLDPNVRWVMDGWQSPEEIAKMAPYVDIWIPELHQVDALPGANTVLAAYRKTGKPVWSYTCFGDMSEQPALGYYRLKPWRVWRSGLDGVCFWSYNSWRGDSLDEFDDAGKVGYTDNAIVYEGDGVPIPSRRWEAFREGLEDYLHLCLCRDAIAAARSRGQASEADAAESRLTAMIEEALSGNATGAQVDRLREELVDMTIRLNGEAGR